MMLKDRKAEKWDLEDEVNRDVWFLNTLAKIKADKEAFYAIKNGPLTIEKVMQRTPTLTRKKAKEVADSLQPSMEEANQRAYRIVIPRISFAKQPALAGKIIRTIEPTEDGHALWQIVLEARDNSGTEKQNELGRKYREFKLTKSTPSPEELKDEFNALEGIWPPQASPP